MTRLSNYQLFVLTVFFQFGSTIVFGFSASSGRDAWIASLASAMLGAGLIAIYLTLARLQPGLTLVQWFPAQFGRWIGTLLAWLYPLAFLYVAGRVLRDFGDLLASMMLNETPFWVIELLYVLLITYAVIHGIDNLARVAEIMFPVVILLLIPLEVILVASSNIMLADRLLPIMERGWTALLKEVWPLNVTVPFGESIVLAMFWTMAEESKSLIKATLLATIGYGMAIATADALAVIVLGDQLFKTQTYPLITLLRQIQVAGFIERLDALIIVQGISIGFFKIALYMLGAVYGIKQLTGIRKERWLVGPAGLIVLLLSIFMAPNVSAHMKTGLKVVPYVLWVPLFLVLPGLLLVTIGAKKWLARRRRKPQTET